MTYISAKTFGIPLPYSIGTAAIAVAHANVTHICS